LATGRSERGQRGSGIRPNNPAPRNGVRRPLCPPSKRGPGRRYFFHSLVLTATVLAAFRLAQPQAANEHAEAVAAPASIEASAGVTRAPTVVSLTVVEQKPPSPLYRTFAEAAPLASSRLSAATHDGLELAFEMARDNRISLEALAAPAPVNTQPACDPGQSPLYCVYTVEDGDTLSKIATKFGLKSSGDIANWDLLVYSNRPDIASAEDFIQPGQKVRIPNDTGVIALVLSSQSPAQVARVFDVTPAEIMGATGPLTPDQVLMAGTELLVRNPKQLGQPAAAAVTTPPTPTATPAVAAATPTPSPTSIATTTVAAATATPIATAALLATATTAVATPVATRAATTTTPSSTRKTGFIWPAAGPISSYFGPNHPLGIDIDLFNNSSAKIAAAATGTVTFAGGNPCCSYGLYVVVDHGNGYTTLYAHLSQLAVVAGQKVGQGDTLGLGGRTGYATGIHLHFEVHYNGAVIDPVSVLP
jgi:murein DD-endopeptidase MepM/ murein hydrolase activator NlpD